MTATAHAAAGSCDPLVRYMLEVERLDPSAITIYLCTDSDDVLKQTFLFPRYRFLYSARIGRYSHKRPPELWDKRIWNFFKWGNTEWTQREFSKPPCDE